MRDELDGARPSRRRLLRAGGVALAAGISSLGAGCTALPPLGREVRYGSVDIPDPAAPAYRDWLPAPSAFPDGTSESDGYNAFVHAPPPADAPAWAQASVSRALLVAGTDYVGFHVDDADVAVTSDSWAALVGDVDPAAVRDTLARTPYEPAGTYAGADVYVRSDRDRVVGVGTEAVVFGIAEAETEAETENEADVETNSRRAMQTILDAGRGSVPRYHEADDDVAALTDSAGTRRWAWLWPRAVNQSTPETIRNDTVGWATAFDHRGGSAYFVETWVFPVGYDPTAGAVRRALKSTSLASRPNATKDGVVDVTVEGRVATVAIYLAPDVARAELADGKRPVPYVTWDSTVDPAADRLTVHHSAGDPVRTDWLTFDGPELTIPAAAAGDVGDRVEPGDSLSVSTADLESGETLRLVFSNPDGPGSTVLFSHDVQ